jgi:menaquinone-specific isochorismate synthase
MWGFYSVEVCVLSVSTALESLYRCLDEAFPPSPGTRIFDIPFALNDAFDPLLWCASAAVAAVLLAAAQRR